MAPEYFAQEDPSEWRYSEGDICISGACVYYQLGSGLDDLLGLGLDDLLGLGSIMR